MSEKSDMEAVKKCLTCLICNNLLDHATTIIECVHSFCKKCIEDKIKEENLKACPVCNTDLGVAPLDKLRTDNKLEDMRRKLFPPKPAAREHKAKKKKKKKPVSSSCKASTSAAQSNLVAPLEPETLEEKVEAVPQIHRPLLREYTRRQRKNTLPNTGSETELPHNEEGENGFEIVLNIEQENGLVGAGTSEDKAKDKEELPISSAKEVTPVKRNGATPIAKPEISLNHTSNGDTDEDTSGEVNQNTNVVVISDGETEKVISSEKPKNNAKENQESSVPDQKLKGKAYSPPVLRSRKPKNADSSAAASTSQNANSKRVWFTLIARKNQHTDRPLPEIPPTYIHLDGNKPISFVKKIVAHKLSLESEDEVEIWLRKELLCETQSLRTVLDWWIMTTPISERKSAMVGSSGEEFVMKLNYSRSHLYP